MTNAPSAEPDARCLQTGKALLSRERFQTFPRAGAGGLDWQPCGHACATGFFPSPQMISSPSRLEQLVRLCKHCCLPVSSAQAVFLRALWWRDGQILLQGD